MNLLEILMGSRILGMCSRLLSSCLLLSACAHSVSSAIVQRYLDPILEAALSTHAHIQSSAIDILTFTIKQGLAHPLQV